MRPSARELASVAIELGAEPHAGELIAELLAELLADGLLCER